MTFASEKEIEFNLTLSDADVQAEDGAPPTFAMVAYTGDAIAQPRFDVPVVVDLSGMSITKKSRPILKDHDTSQIVGHTTDIENDKRTLTASGVISGASEAAAEVVATAKKGFQWQASIGARVTSFEHVKEGTTVELNGRSFEGPIIVAKKSRLSEISFVALGADDATSASVSAESDKGHSSVELTEGQKVELSIQTEKENRMSEDLKALETIKAEMEATKKDMELIAAAGSNTEALELARENNWDVPKLKSHLELEAMKAELADLKAKAPTADFNIHVAASKPKNEENALTSALMLSLGYDESDIVDPKYGLDSKKSRAMGEVAAIDPEDVEFARKNMKGFGLSDAALYAAKANGYVGGNLRDADAIQASFNWVKSPTVYKNVIDRILIRNYQWEDLTWNQVASVRSVRDFKAYQSFRVYGMGHWEKLSPQGEMGQGHLVEEAGYTNQADTYGQVNVISRKQLIDDDLGILNDMGSSMARWGSLAPEHVLVNMLDDGLYRDGTTFFSAGNGNLQTTTPFGYAGVKSAYEAFVQQASPQSLDKNRGAEPKIKAKASIIYAPYELEIDVEDFFNTRDFTVSRGAKGTTSRNPFYARFNRVYSPYLADSSWGGGLSTTWYMIGDVNTGVPAMEFAFLNGVQRPTIETGSNIAHDRLGIYVRGYYDFGMNFQEKKAIQKCTA